MKLKSVIDSPCGLRFCFEMLTLQSGYSRHRLLDKEMILSDDELVSLYDRVNELRDVFCCPENKVYLQTLEFKLQGIKNIEQTISKLEFKRVLDDIELFEVKHLAILSLDVSEYLDRFDIASELDVKISEVLDILDPDGLKTGSFYIYDSYSKELGDIRIQIRNTPQGEMRQELIARSVGMEAVVRRDISQKLSGYASLLMNSLHQLSELDIALAKGVMMKNHHFIFPEISQGDCSFTGLFNPLVQDALAKSYKVFQKIDISYGAIPTLIIGANMGGKTVVLKSLALCQFLFQFGFPIPCSSAKMKVREKIFLITGDAQSEVDGLSSFSSEMKRINEVVISADNGENILALIDEPARSTNPIEGTALVSSLINVLYRRKIALVLTTHYNVSVDNCRRLKVNGLKNGVMNYSLSECSASVVPHEALNVAVSIGISREWIDEAKKLLKQ